jgi:hypothetical protein
MRVSAAVNDFARKIDHQAAAPVTAFQDGRMTRGPKSRMAESAAGGRPFVLYVRPRRVATLCQPSENAN